MFPVLAVRSTSIRSSIDGHPKVFIFTVAASPGFPAISVCAFFPKLATQINNAAKAMADQILCGLRRTERAFLWCSEIVGSTMCQDSGLPQMGVDCVWGVLSLSRRAFPASVYAPKPNFNSFRRLPLSVLVETVRENGRTKQRIIRNLGRKEMVEARGDLDRLARSAARLSRVG
jgi:hypothetical protein